MNATNGSHASHHHPPVRCSRRGVVIAVALLIVMVLGLAVAGSVRPLAQESDLAALRVETARAFYAAESGVLLHLAASNAGLPGLSPGDAASLGVASFERLGPDGPGEELIVEGQSGSASRRITVTLD